LRLEGTRAILRRCDRGAVAVLLAKLTAEACDDWEVCPGWWRTWSASAVTRP
jgi:hypothetical protein